MLGEESGAVLYFCNSLISDLIDGVWILLFDSVVCWEIKNDEASEELQLGKE